MNLLLVLCIIGVVLYIKDMIFEPEKHLFGLVVLAVLYGIFGSFFDTTGAKSDYDRKKRG